MDLSTTEPGLIVFDGRITGAFGLEDYAGCCLEPQMWPDAPRHTEFPPITHHPGDLCHVVTEYRFRTSSD